MNTSRTTNRCPHCGCETNKIKDRRIRKLNNGI